MYIYKITNMLNNKFYIGQTINPSSRWKAHQKCSTSKVGNAILSCGVKNFEFMILFECNQRDANLLESYLIYKYRLIEQGYNVTYSKHLTEMDYYKAEVLLTEIYSGTYTLTGEYMAKSGDMRKVYCVEDNIIFDNATECATFYTIATATRVRDVCLGKRATANNLTFRYLDDNGCIVEPEGSARKKTTEVYVEETCTFYPSLKDACDNLGLDYRTSNSSIIKHLEGKTEHAYHYHFHYVDNGKVLPSKYISGKTRRKVIVDNLHVFDSVVEAIKYYNLPSGARGAISQCCRGKSSNAYGHTWSYLDDNDNPIVNEFIIRKVDKRSVICDDSLVFESISEAVRHFSLKDSARTGIKHACDGVSGMAYGHTWKYI